MNLFSLPLKTQTDLELFGISYFNDDFYALVFRMCVNIVVLTLLIRFMYYPKSRRKDYLFTYYLIGMITFFLCFGLKKLDIDTGMGLGLFAIFSILRYRTEGIEIKEMTYLFLVIGISVVNALASNKISLAEMGLINGVLLAITFGLENIWLLKHETRKIIQYERIDLIKPELYSEMLADVEERTGLKINRIEVGKIDFLRDTAQLRIFYDGDIQSFGSSVETSDSSAD
jgi:hypothetical protein|uniref:DUF4956 domain-containing protein n=1 Tax=Fluviicola sp. TaxID=1917219 RepID=UPI00404A3420